MKKLFTLSVLICFSFGMANAQDKTEIKAERITKIESKEALKKAQVKPKKIDAAKIEQRSTTGHHVDSQNSKNVVRTNAVKGVPVKTNSTKTLDKAPVKVEK